MSTVRKPGFFCGAAIDLSRRFRVLSFLTLTLISACLCYSQFGIMAWGADMTGDVNIVFFLIPVALCIVMLGVGPGVGLAFLTGMLIMIRSQWTPTSMLDFNMCDPFLSVVNITFGAILMATIVTLAARKWPANLESGVNTFKRIGPARYISLIIGSFVFSFTFSYFARGLLYLFITPGGAEYGYAAMIELYLETLSGPLVSTEASINGLMLSITCIASVCLDASRRSGTWQSGLNTVFNRWLIFGTLVVFLLASSVSFCVETTQANDEASEKILAELDYLKQQVTTYEASGTPIESVAEGYTESFGGTVIIIHDHTVVSTNNPKYAGISASEVLSSGDVDNYDFLVERATQDMLTGGDEETREFHAIRALIDNGYDYVAITPLAKMYKGRTSAVFYNAGFFLVMLLVVFIIVHILLRGIVVGPIHRMNKTLGYITEGELQRRVDERRVTEFDELSTGINTTVTSLRNMVDEVASRNEQDLMAAKAIQESALPREFPPFPDIDRFDIYASMKTAKEVGGDFYDFFLVDDDRLAFLIADVSGKGIPAALFMMTAKTQLRTYLESGLPVDEAVNAANHQLCIGNEAGMFVTGWIGVLEYQTGKLEFVNAGHNPPLRHSKSWEWIREVSGMPLGLFDGIPYDKHTCQLSPKDTLYLYTDGVTEAMNTDGELFSEERLMETLDRYTGENSRTISVGIRRAITDFTLDAAQSDDITMLTLRYGVPPETRASMTLSADVNQLIHVYNFIHEELRRRGAPKSVYNPLDIAAEELFVNVCHYAYPDATPDNPGEARIEFEYKPNPPSLTVSISDDGVPYNPLEKPDAVTPDDIADVPIGGLGILMSKRSVDDMTYERIDESNVLTFTKSW